MIIQQLHSNLKSKILWGQNILFWCNEHAIHLDCNASCEKKLQLSVFSNNKIKRRKVCCERNNSLQRNIFFGVMHANFWLQHAVRVKTSNLSLFSSWTHWELFTICLSEKVDGSTFWTWPLLHCNTSENSNFDAIKIGASQLSSVSFRVVD